MLFLSKVNHWLLQPEPEKRSPELLYKFCFAPFQTSSASTQSAKRCSISFLHKFTKLNGFLIIDDLIRFCAIIKGTNFDQFLGESPCLLDFFL